ncbi:hypothetical protein A2572_02020 [Candidatus Collierbacteria bacterium RIFOXYD1_FULL_40_9]|uniref:BioF2-like acetyltransferase domain-containing protein n=1 Tax=Candidatus Collierbacteria bacterium RIFOXYD1_FULL_40_9 TaxID=1817731 RepID=A0A1F5FTB7_9BACT|nr:MAG: hypothetical protein A2572_02020 [Candidatus Collierbacteria bacterium RIFOXYD1_FULL_40_9]
MVQDIRQNQLWLAYCKTKGYKILSIPTKSTKTIWGIAIPIGFFGLKMLKIQRAVVDPDWLELKRIKRVNRVVSTIIEPQKINSRNNYKKWGYRLSNFPYLATKTVVVDLKQTEKDLWHKLSENSKRLVKKNEKLKIREVSGEEFLELWKPNSKIWTMKLIEMEEIKKVLGDKSKYLVSYLGDEPQSGIILIETNNTAYYLHSFTTKEGRKTGAHFKMVWEVLVEEKKRGMSFFDFEGIYDKRWPQKKWLGFTEFKKKFGGKTITFPGCFHRWF